MKNKITFTEAAGKYLIIFYAKMRGNLSMKDIDKMSLEELERSMTNPLSITVKDLLRWKANAIKAAKARGSSKVTVRDVRGVLSRKS